MKKLSLFFGASRNTVTDLEGIDVASYDRPCADNHTLADKYSGTHNHSCAKPNIVTNCDV